MLIIARRWPVFIVIFPLCCAASQPQLWPKWYSKLSSGQASLDVKPMRSSIECLQWASCGSEQCGYVRCKKRPNGYGCRHNSECISGTCYRRDVCVGPGKGVVRNNEQCYTSIECASGYCSYGYCDDKKTVGHRCDKASACISDNCWNNHCQQKDYHQPEDLYDNDGGEYDFTP